MSSADAETDALFRLPLAEFTAARNALAARLKKAGRAEDAARVKALVKPSISAWAVNQVYWHHRAAFDQLLAVGERFREAQASQLAGRSTNLREPLDARREALATLTRTAAEALRAGGHAPAPDTMRRITTTLEALSTYGGLPEAPRAGRLVDDVDPPGFETLAALVPRIASSGEAARAEGAPPRVLPFRNEPARGRASKRKETDAEKQARVAAARAAVQQSERALKEARRAAERAEAALRTAAARTRDADQAKEEAERRLEQATAAATEARQQARRAAVDAEQAAQEVADAERALDRARQQLETPDT